MAEGADGVWQKGQSNNIFFLAHSVVSVVAVIVYFLASLLLLVYLNCDLYFLCLQFSSPACYRASKRM